MAKVPAAVATRLKSEVPRFQKILQSARDKDINEADTVVIITDMLEQVFGLDKYEDITREFAIQGTFVDLAVRTKNSIDYLIEVKAVGIDLKDNHLRQAIGYASKEGVRWVVLTNGIEWEIYRVLVDGQVTSDRILAFNFLDMNMRRNDDMETLFMLCKRAISKDLIEEFYEHKQACNRFTIGALLVSDPVVSLVRRQLKQMTPGLKSTIDEVRDIISAEVLKREVRESEAAQEASRKVKRAMVKAERAKAAKKTKPASVQEHERQEGEISEGML